MLLNAKTALDGFPELLAILQKEVDQYKQKANEIFPVVQPVGEWPKLNSFTFGYGKEYNLSNSQRFFKTRNYYSSSDTDFTTEGDITRRKEEIEARIEQLEQQITAVEESNKDAIDNNTKLREKITLVMQSIGVPSTHSVWECPKGARTNKRVTHTAGYISDMNRCIPISVKGIKPDVKALRSAVEQKHKEALEVVHKVEREAQQKADEVKKQHELALLRAKYCPENAYAGVEAIMDVILSKDKYLRLAYWMERNRGDWSDGYSFAERGHDSFVVEDDTDKEIDEEIGSLIQNENGDYVDGRCFRDCKWNYGVLYSMVKDAVLFADFLKIKDIE